MLNLRKAGIRVAPEEQVEKPVELKRYEQMKETGLPLVAGGVMDQPHIWLEQLGVIRNVINLFDAMARASEPPKQPS